MKLYKCLGVLCLGALAAWADVSGTPTLSPGTVLNLDTGATGGSGGDLLWDGSSLTVRGNAMIAILGIGVQSTQVYDTLTANDLKNYQYVATTFPIPIPSLVSMLAVHTNGGNYAKMLVTGGTSGGSITTKFLTYGASGGGNNPSISSVQNNYGQIPDGLPNYGIAPGTIFFIKGSNLSATTTSLLSSASPGLQTTQNGVSVSVTVGGTTLPCPLYYLSPTQLDAVLPAGTPLGTGTVTVTNNGALSSAYSIKVVQSAFGILSYNGTLAAAYDANNNLITSSNAANPNQAIVLWGSGVGADLNNDDKLYPQKQNNLTGIPLQAYVGGVQATIAYRGRSQFPGLDQVVLTIPGSVPTGCYVSLALVSGSIVTNSVTIPIAASGRTCTDSGTSLPPDVLQNLSGKTTIRQGFLSVSQATDITAQGSTTTNSVFGSFQSVTGYATSAGANQVSVGSCIVYNSISYDPSSGTASGLDAGAAIAVNGPAGSVTLNKLTVPGLGLGFYATSDLTVPSGFIPPNGGAYAFDNGSGGADVQHFNATLTLPQTLTWTNASQIASVNRSQGVMVTWTGGATGSYVNISGDSTANGVTVSFVCEAPVSAGQFTVPVPVLLALPAGSGSLTVGSYNFNLFSAPGLDLGLLLGSSQTSKDMSYN